MALKPVADRVIVKYFETEDKTASGIVLPDSSKEKTQQAEVIAVGSGRIVDGKEVPIQVKDERTGEQYSRTLPIDYYENANVLKLSGENLDGSSSSIVFYSVRGMEKLKDLTGKGVDHDPCGTHKSEDL